MEPSSFSLAKYGNPHNSTYKNDEQFHSFIMNIVLQYKTTNVVKIREILHNHKTSWILDFLEEKNIPHIFNVPYSPQYNGIELVFAYLKQCLMKRFLIQTLLLTVITK